MGHRAETRRVRLKPQMSAVDQKMKVFGQNGLGADDVQLFNKVGEKISVKLER